MVTITIDGENATFTFEKTGDKQKILDISEDAARYLCKIQNIDYDSLSNSERLAILNEKIIYELKEWARTYSINNASDTARDNARITSETKYNV